MIFESELGETREVDTFGRWHYANGKVILFGEHAVVYGVEAIAAAMPNAVRACIASRSGIDADVSRLTIPSWGVDIHLNAERADSEGAESLLINMCLLIVRELDVGHDQDDRHFHLKIESELPPASGMGASAAIAVASIKALSEYFGRTLTLEQINTLALRCEEIAHGTPSGLDNTLATYGGVLRFKKMEGGMPSVFEPIALARPLTLLVTHSGKKGYTAETVARVRRNKEQFPEKHLALFARVADISARGRAALEVGDESLFAVLLNENQQCLRELGVSCDEIERVLTIAVCAGAEGVKLTGSGDGGALIIAPGRAVDAVQTKLRDEGLMCFQLNIGGCS